MKLIYDAHLAFKKRMAPQLMTYGLRPGNQRILAFLSNHPGCLQKDIAEYCDVDTSTLSTVLSRMEKKGFIEIKRFEKNKRSYSIYLTENGQKIADEAMTKLNATSNTALTGFSDKEITELNSYLSRIIENLKSST